MIIGFDLDEVLANFLDVLIRFYNERYKTSFGIENFSTYNIWEVWGVTQEEAFKRLHSFYTTPYFKSIKPVQGAVEGIEVLKQNNELLVITSRPQDIAEETKAWIDSYFPNKFLGTYFTNRSRKSELCLKLGIEIIVEDCLEYAIDCAANGTRTLLFGNYPWNQTSELPEDIFRVYSWNDIVEKFAKKR